MPSSADTQVRGNSQVSGASDEIPEPMVVALLRARGSPHLDDRRCCLTPVFRWESRLEMTRPLSKR